MSTTNRNQPWKYGDRKPVTSKAVVSAVTIAKGDMVGQSATSFTGATSGAALVAGDVYPASDRVWNTDLATTQTDFVATFLGIANGRSRATEVDPLDVDTAGVHEFDCASFSPKVGDKVGPAKQAGNLLEDQKVAAVATSVLAVGRVAKAGTNITKVLVDVFSVVSGDLRT